LLLSLPIPLPNPHFSTHTLTHTLEGDFVDAFGIVWDGC